MFSLKKLKEQALEARDKYEDNYVVRFAFGNQVLADPENTTGDQRITSQPARMAYKDYVDVLGGITGMFTVRRADYFDGDSSVVNADEVVGIYLSIPGCIDNYQDYRDQDRLYNMSLDKTIETKEKWTKNRAGSIAWFSTVEKLRKMYSASEDLNYGVGTFIKNVVVISKESENTVMVSTRDEATAQRWAKNQHLYIMLNMIAELELTSEDLRLGIVLFKQYIEGLDQRIENIKRFDTKESSGLTKVLEPVVVNRSMINEEFELLMKQLPSNGLVSRTWGFEIEVPDSKGIEPVQNSQIEKGSDGSLRSYRTDDCDCGCSSCVYHECDCESCENNNDDPQHDCGYDSCTQADSAEYRSLGGLTKLKVKAMYDLCERLVAEDAEMNDTAGTHIHVFAQDLSTNQVGQVLAIYKKFENMFGAVCGRQNVQYAGNIEINDIAKALDSRLPKLRAHKTLAVNVMHLGNMGRGTIEFRGMDCNLDADRMTTWAWLVRGLVTAAKRGARFIDFKDVTSISGIVSTLAKFNYFVDNENPEDVVYGSKTDSAFVPRVMHIFSN